MIRFTLGIVGLAVGGLASAAEPPRKAAPLEVVLLGDTAPARIELDVEVDGKPLPAIWDETFARLAAFFDRNGDGKLDAKEADSLPSAVALRQAIGNGFTPPVGSSPPFEELDRDRDGQVTPAELAAYYRSKGLGNALIGVGRLPASDELTTALLKQLDSNGDGQVTEKEWKAAAETLKKLDTNDDELIGAGELVPRILYPSAAGTALLTPPTADASSTDVAAKLPLILLPADEANTEWAAEIVRRGKQKGSLTAAGLIAWRKQKPDARWVVRIGTEKAAGERLAFVTGRHRIEGWITPGKGTEAATVAIRQLTAQFENPTPEPESPTGGNRRRGSSLAWLTPIADRNGDGKVDSKEFQDWLDLQAQIARGQVLVSLLDSGTGLFEILDANHDGALSVRELRGAWGRLGEFGCVKDQAFDRAKVPHLLLAAASQGYPVALSLAPKTGPAWFRAMDRNGDGDVSRREFTGPPETFNKLDKDANGLLDPQEAASATPGK